jgi:hypothetical protein
MISALYRYPKRQRSSVASVWGKRGAASNALRRIAAGPDAETLRKRALDDRRGSLVRELFKDGSHVRVVHSVRGRTDQLDALIDGNLWRTCGPRKLPIWLR